MLTIAKDITATIGNTPVVRLARLEPAHVELYAKLEAFNPGGSVKDRMALGVLDAAERSGDLRRGQTIVEATSGNTGIALAMICARRGYPFVAVMAENFSVERRRLMRFLGARVVLTPASERGSGMFAKASELAERYGWFMPRQFENEANADAHARTTAPEILEAFEGRQLDYWVTGAGTGGTLKGVARVLRQARPEIRIIVCEPDNAAVLSSGIPQDRHADGIPVVPHPAFRPHPMQGWSPDFIPPLTENALAAGYVDQILPVAGAHAMAACRQLARREGILAGITGGATLAAALAVAESAAPGSRILCMLPDTGERYLSTPLFADVPIDMTDEELEISCSTPGLRFDGGGSVKPAVVPASVPETTPEAVAFVDDTVADESRPVVLFGLEWCEFSWSVRRMFAHFGVPFRSIELDSAVHRVDGFGGAVRAALGARTGMRTIPQVFVGRTFVGGCTDLFDAWNKGSAQALLADAGVGFRSDLADDPYRFLPAWLHPRS